jgi:hypothetical protein
VSAALDPAERRGRRLLVLGAVAGIALTAWGLLGSDARESTPDDAVAVVNGQPLSRDAFERFVDAVAAERRTAALPLEERQRILDRLVDEELLLQYGIGLGLARHEPTARRMIVQSVIASVTGAAEDVEPSEADLRDYYAAHPDRFVRPGRIVVEALVAPVGGERSDEAARAAAEKAARRLADGAALGGVVEAVDGVQRARLPGGPLPVETLRRYLGPTAALRARELEPGRVSEPFRASAGYLVLRGVRRSDDVVPPFEAVVDSVRAEWIRSRGEEALRRFLDDLRAAADLRQADLAAEAREKAEDARGGIGDARGEAAGS